MSDRPLVAVVQFRRQGDQLEVFEELGVAGRDLATGGEQIGEPIELGEHHPGRDTPLVTRDTTHPAPAHRIPLLLGERYRGERDDLLLLVVEVRLDDRVELVERCRQCFAGLGRGPLAPGRACGQRGVQGGRNLLVLVLDLFCHRGLLRHTLDELGVEQLIFVLVMGVQAAKDEIDVIGQEGDPLR